MDTPRTARPSAAHLRNLPRLAQLLREKGGGDKLLIAGGVIPAQDAPAIHAAGYQRIFTMGTNTSEIVKFIHDWRARHAGAAQSVAETLDE